MNIKKYFEILFDNNDVYILETINNNIIINDNNKALVVFDNHLKEKKRLETPGVNSIYGVFKSCNGTDLLVYSPEDQALVYGSIVTGTTFTITINETDDVFLPAYYWKNSTIVLATYHQYYQVSLNDKKITEISEKQLRAHYEEFYQFLLQIKTHIVVGGIDSCTQQFLFKDEVADLIIPYGYAGSEKIAVSCLAIPAHDILYQKGIFIFVAEKEILAIYNDQKLYIFPKVGYTFRHARFLYNNNQLMLVILENNTGNNLLNNVGVYLVED